MSDELARLAMRGVNYRIRGHRLIDNVSLHSASGNCTALLGANGAGKSTFLRLCHGLRTPSSGEIRWGDKPPQDVSKHITMVFQKPYLLKRTARANVKYALRVRKVPRSECDKHVQTALESVNLAHRADHQANWLSGGEQRRLAIARAWALRPRIILMDEPTAGLDIASTRAVEQIITDLKRQGIKIIIASHHLAQVRRLCDEIIFLDKGKVILQSPTQAFFENPKHEVICDFIRSQTFS